MRALPFTDAPASTKYLSTSRWPSLAAASEGVRPSNAVASMPASCFGKVCTLGKSPDKAASTKATSLCDLHPGHTQCGVTGRPRTGVVLIKQLDVRTEGDRG